jgi:hypothetical protein
MATETIEFTVSGLSQAVGGMNTMAAAVAGVSIPGAGAVSGLSALTSALSKMPAPAVAAVTAIGAVGTALTAFVALAQNGAHALQEFGSLQGRLASSGQDTAFLQLAGQFTGQNAGSTASSLRQGAYSGLGAMALGQIGVGLPPPIDVGGAFDEGAYLKKVLKATEQTYEQDPSRALAALRNLHLQGWEPFIMAGKEGIAMLEQEAKIRAEINTPEHIAAALKFNLAIDMLKAKFVDFAAMIFKLIPGFGPGSSQLAHVQDEHTKAMEQHSAALNATFGQRQFGLAGGGPGFRSAIPGGYQSSVEAGRSLKSDAARWGAYSVAM